MAKTNIANLVTLAITLLIGLISAEYRHKIEPFSFDTRKFEYPLEFAKYGTAVTLRNHIKLLPKVENRFGGMFMKEVSL